MEESMIDRNSHASFVLGTLGAVLLDCAAYYPALTKEFERDYTRLSSAIDKHGVRFVLDTMPAWRKHFDQCLAQGRLTSSRLTHFGAGGSKGTIPRLLRGLVLRVFDSSGALRPDADETAVRLIRQLLGACRKLRLPCPPKLEKSSVEDFIRIDSEVRQPNLNWDRDSDIGGGMPVDRGSFTDLRAGEDRNQGDLFGDPLQPGLKFEHARCIQQAADWITAYLGTFDPWAWGCKHGPGAVADRRFGSYRYDFDRWSARLDRVFPYEEFALANLLTHGGTRSLIEGSLGGWINHDPPAVLRAVPKTVTGPRLIACEPSHLQWTQQAVRDFFYDRVSKTPVGAFVDFRRQDLNGQLAARASQGGTHATIDLSSASDRLSCWFVERLFRRSPTILEALKATRSQWLRQDISGRAPRFIKLRKYSTMGNATTFPVQSLAFLAVALGSLAYKRDERITTRWARSLGRLEVRVFGDDIIVPGDCAELVMGALTAFGLKVNDAKTFTVGNFRESCGVDAFKGVNVTTVNVLDVPKRAAPGSIVSSVDVHNNLLSRGYANTATWIRKTVEQAGFTQIRSVPHGSGCFGWSDLLGYVNPRVRTRWNTALQRRETRCLNVKVKAERRSPGGNPALLQYFIEAPRVVTSGVSTIGHLARRPKVSLTLGWEH